MQSMKQIPSASWWLTRYSLTCIRRFSVPMRAFIGPTWKKLRDITVLTTLFKMDWSRQSTRHSILWFRSISVHAPKILFLPEVFLLLYLFPSSCIKSNYNILNSCYAIKEGKMLLFLRLMVIKQRKCVMSATNPVRSTQKTTVERWLISYLIKNPSKTKKAFWALLNKQEQIHKWRYPMDS